MNKFAVSMTDHMITVELFSRLESQRKALALTQIELARRVGITPKTYRSLKQGACSVMVLLSILRQLNLLENLDMLVPDPQIRPNEIWKQSLSSYAKQAKRKVEKMTNVSSSLSLAEDNSGAVYHVVSKKTRKSDESFSNTKHIKQVLASRKRLKTQDK